MSWLSSILEHRRRRRTVSTLDSAWRDVARSLESRAKLLLMKALAAWIRPVKKPLPLSIEDIHSVLILRYDALGDAILATPVWRAIKASNPNIHIGVVGSIRNIAFLREDESIDSTYIFSRGFSLSLLKELVKVRKRKWDMVLNLYFHDKTRGAIFARLAARGAVSATAVRNNRNQYEAIYSFVGKRPANVTPIVEQNIALAEKVIALPLDARPVRPILPASLLNAKSEIAGKYIILHTEASQDYKEWGTPNNLTLTRLILEKTHFQVFWTSSTERRDACARALKELVSERARYFPTPSLVALAQIIGGATAVISPDTSVIHFATAQQVPVVGLYLEENDFLPYGGPSRVLFSIDKKNVSSILPRLVFEALEELLAVRSH